MQFYTNEEMIKIQRELLTTPKERREGVLVRYGVLKEEFPDVEFEEEKENYHTSSSSNDTESSEGSGCCGIFMWIGIIIVILWIFGKI